MRFRLYGLRREKLKRQDELKRSGAKSNRTNIAIGYIAFFSDPFNLEYNLIQS